MNDDLTAERLAKVVHEGQRTMPEDRPMLICKPKQIESWRVFKIMAEFVEGFDIIRQYGLAVTIFGTARASFEDKVYKNAEALTKRLSKRGFAVITGGSAGVMQAANKGAFEAGGISVGFNINLPNVQYYNPYLTEKFSFDHFFVRKVILTYASEVYVYFPGGLGTLNEFFEIITLVQTGKIRKMPIILFGREYWTPLLSFIEKTLYEKHAAIDEKDLKLYTLVDSVDEAYEYIVAHISC
ncbi:MAG: TIGR00730 family Rossman fold protein [Candidatus Paceibacterota bacterium]|jgi:hypothetical protein